MPPYACTDVKKINKTFHLHDATFLSKWLLTLFSLDTAEKRTNKSEKCWYLFKCITSVVVFGTLDVFTLIWKINNIFPQINSTIVMTDVFQMSYDYSQYIIDLLFIYKYGREVSQEYFKNYEFIDKILDMTHYEEIKNRVLKLSAFLIFFWIITSIIDFIAWGIDYGLMSPLVYSLSYIFVLIKTMTNLDLTVQIINVECRLRVFGDLLQDAYNSIDNIPAGAVTCCIEDSLNNKHWFYNEGCNRALEIRSKNHPLKYKSQNGHDVKWMSQCYLLLNEQCTFINHMYGIRILLNSLSFLIDMVRFLNLAIRLVKGSMTPNWQLPATSTLMRFLECVIILTSVVYHSERTYAQTDRITRIVDHILVNKSPDEALKSSVSDLRALVISRPISFNMANFFRLSYPFLISMASVVVTYTIILLQSS